MIPVHPVASASRHVTMAGWKDAPHLDAQTQAELLASTPPHLRKARSEGTPSLGAGAIYPVEEEVWLVEPFPLPAFWPRSYGMDVGWNKTAVVWQAHDRDEDVVYLYAEHYRGQAEPSIHASAIKARGEWINGVIDPASEGTSQIDGARLMAMYKALGLHLAPAENSVEAGIYEVWERLSTGRLKVFSTLSNLRNEFRLYRRSEKGKIVKEFDHAMDAMRYLILSGLQRATVKPVQRVAGSEARALADPVGGY